MDNSSKNPTSLTDLTNIRNDALTSDDIATVSIMNNSSDAYLGKAIPHEVADSFRNTNSSAIYRFVYNDVDLSIDIQSRSMIWSVSFDSINEIPESLTYRIKANGLQLERTKNDGFALLNSEGEIVFEVPVFTLSDSSIYNESRNVDFDVEQNGDSYYITVFPLLALKDFQEAVYPLSVSNEYTVTRNSTNYYNSKLSPNEIIRDEYLRISNISGYGNQTYVTCNDSFGSFGKNATIIDANFNMFLRGNYLSKPKTVKIYSSNVQPLNCT